MHGRTSFAQGSIIGFGRGEAFCERQNPCRRGQPRPRRTDIGVRKPGKKSSGLASLVSDESTCALDDRLSSNCRHCNC
jgi:hypothetical protein